MDEYLPQVDGEPKKNPPDGKKRTEALENTFIFAMIWSVCATVNEDGRASLDRFLRQLLAGEKEEGQGEDGEEGAFAYHP